MSEPGTTRLEHNASARNTTLGFKIRQLLSGLDYLLCSAHPILILFK